MMDFLIELIGELLLELALNKKVSPFIRYPLLAIFSIIYGGITLVFILMGIDAMKESLTSAILPFIVVLFLLWLIRKLILKYWK